MKSNCLQFNRPLIHFIESISSMVCCATLNYSNCCKTSHTWTLTDLYKIHPICCRYSVGQWTYMLNDMCYNILCYLLADFPKLYAERCSLQAHSVCKYILRTTLLHATLRQQQTYDLYDLHAARCMHASVRMSYVCVYVFTMHVTTYYIWRCHRDSFMVRACYLLQGHL